MKNGWLTSKCSDRRMIPTIVIRMNGMKTRRMWLEGKHATEGVTPWADPTPCGNHRMRSNEERMTAPRQPHMTIRSESASRLRVDFVLSCIEAVDLGVQDHSARAVVLCKMTAAAGFCSCQPGACDNKEVEGFLHKGA